MLMTGDRLGYDFAFTSLIQSLDGSVVRDQERLAYTGSSGLMAQIVDTYNKYQGTSDPELLAVLGRQTDALRTAVRDNTNAGIESYQQQAEAFGGDWSRIGSVVPESFNAGPKPTVTPSDDAPATPQAEPVPGERTAAAVAAVGSTVWAAVPDWFKTSAGVSGVLASPTVARALLPKLLSAAGWGVAGLGAGVVFAGEALIDEAGNRAEITPMREGETEAEYVERVYAELSRISGGNPFIQRSDIGQAYRHRAARATN